MFSLKRLKLMLLIQMLKVFILNFFKFVIFETLNHYRILRLRREQPLTLKVMEPSQAFLEEAISEQSEQRLPPDVLYMLKSIRLVIFVSYYC